MQLSAQSSQNQPTPRKTNGTSNFPYFLKVRLSTNLALAHPSIPPLSKSPDLSELSIHLNAIREAFYSSDPQAAYRARLALAELDVHPTAHQVLSKGTPNARLQKAKLDEITAISKQLACP